MGVSNEIDTILRMFGEICDATATVVRGATDWGESGQRDGQYLVDLDVDELCVVPLLAAGFCVLSEESGYQHPPGGEGTAGTVVVDPLDGSTNASLGLPWFATSLCLVHDGEPMVSMVTNLVTGVRYHAIRGAGAWRDGTPIEITREAPLGEAIVAVSGWPSHHYGWRQFRAMGASALDLCGVAAGSFDGFVDMSDDAHGVWDYLGALLILQEAGGVAADALGRELLVLDHEARRTPVAATNGALLEELLAHRAQL